MIHLENICDTESYSVSLVGMPGVLCAAIWFTPAMEKKSSEETRMTGQHIILEPYVVKTSQNSE